MGGGELPVEGETRELKKKRARGRKPREHGERGGTTLPLPCSLG